MILRIGSLAWLGYRTHTAGVAGSNPARSMFFNLEESYHNFLRNVGPVPMRNEIFQPYFQNSWYA